MQPRKLYFCGVIPTELVHKLAFGNHCYQTWVLKRNNALVSVCSTAGLPCWLGSEQGLSGTQLERQYLLSPHSTISLLVVTAHVWRWPIWGPGLPAEVCWSIVRRSQPVPVPGPEMRSSDEAVGLGWAPEPMAQAA